MVARPLLTFGPLILVAGSTLLLFFIVLAGVKQSSPLTEFFFLSVDTSSITGAPPVSHWTLWNICNGESGSNTACGHVQPAFPFQPQSNFNTMKNIPAEFMNNSSFYYYTSRVDFAFFLIAVAFSSFSFLTGFLALCSRIGSGLAAILAFCGLLASIVAAALMTVVWIRARDGFNTNNMTASVGLKMFAFAWTSVACLLLATIGFCGSCCIGRGKDSSSSRMRFWRRQKAYNAETVNGSF